MDKVEWPEKMMDSRRISRLPLFHVLHIDIRSPKLRDMVNDCGLLLSNGGVCSVEWLSRILMFKSRAGRRGFMLGQPKLKELTKPVERRQTNKSPSPKTSEALKYLYHEQPETLTLKDKLGEHNSLKKSNPKQVQAFNAPKPKKSAP